MLFGWIDLSSLNIGGGYCVSSCSSLKILIYEAAVKPRLIWLYQICPSTSGAKMGDCKDKPVYGVVIFLFTGFPHLETFSPLLETPSLSLRGFDENVCFCYLYNPLEFRIKMGSWMSISRTLPWA